MLTLPIFTDTIVYGKFLFAIIGCLKGVVRMLVSFLNIFLCPMISLALSYRIRKRKLMFSAEFFVSYCILTVCNMPLTKIMVVMVEKIFDKQVELYSTYYTMLAMVSAVVLPYVWHVFRVNVSASVEINKNDEDREHDKKVA